MGIACGKAPEEPKTTDEGPTIEEALEHLRRVGLLPSLEDNTALGWDALRGVKSNPERALRLIRAVEAVAGRADPPPGIGSLLQEVLKAYVILSDEDRKARRYVRIGQCVGLDGKLHPPSPIIDTQPEQGPDPNSMTYRLDGRPQPRVDNRLAVAEQKLQTEVEINKKLRLDKSSLIDLHARALFAQNKRWAMWCRLVSLGSILFVLALSTAGLLFGGVAGAWTMLLCASLTAAILVPALIIEALHEREHKRCGGTIGY
jgi:hypothetical protein